MAKKIAKKLTPQARIRQLTEKVRDLQKDFTQQREFTRDEEGTSRRLRQQVDDLQERLTAADARAFNSHDLAMRAAMSLQQVTHGATLMQATICEVLKRLVPDPAAKSAAPPATQ